MAGMMSPALEEKIPPKVGDGAGSLDSEQGSEAETEDQPNVTPEEQQAYEDFVADGLLLIYEGGEVRPTILEMLDEDPSDLMEILGDVAELKDFSPIVALAATAVVVVLELVRRAGENKPDDAVIMHGGKEILEDLANLAEEAKIHEYTPEELNRAWYMGMDLWREAASEAGLIDTEELKAEFGAIKEADERGEFGGEAEAPPTPVPPVAPSQPARGMMP